MWGISWILNLFHRNKDLEEEVKILKLEIETLKQKNVDLNQIINLKFPNSLGNITMQEVASLFNQYDINVSISDYSFDLTSMEEAKAFTQETAVSSHVYITEKHDCENFSFALLGYWSNGLKSFAFGYARSLNHAFNVMIDNEKTIWIIEPQTNEWLKYSDVYKNKKYKQYQITQILM